MLFMVRAVFIGINDPKKHQKFASSEEWPPKPSPGPPLPTRSGPGDFCEWRERSTEFIPALSRLVGASGQVHAEARLQARVFGTGRIRAVFYGQDFRDVFSGRVW